MLVAESRAGAPEGLFSHGWLPIGVFIAILAQGASIGLTDDEAYYWVLAQRPALGYAFHPPAVALSIAAAQAMFGWLLGHHCVGLVRLPAAFCAAALVALGTRWVREALGETQADGRVRVGWVVVAFAGMYALSWMIVPDFPMFLGWTLAFVATWRICHAPKDSVSARLLLSGGIALAILSKFSAVLGAASAALAIWFWAPRERRWSGLIAVVAGGLLAAAPILWWNSQHEWGAILYQIRERHSGGELSLLRYLRFWVIELVLMGLPLFIYLLSVVARWIRGRASRVEKFALVWAAPGGMVFCSQPLWADFKPHWALIVWWPLVLSLAWASARGEFRRLVRAHLAYGLILMTLVWISCQLPVASWAVTMFRGNAAGATTAMDPRLDVTNDLYGWADLRGFVIEQLGAGALEMPFTGARYQTASQATFALGSGAKVTLLPRDLKAMDEWPDLGVSDAQGPGWPKLFKPIYYVADNRYDAPPEYLQATCVRTGELNKSRLGYPAKTIYLWKCEPRSAQP